MLCKHRGTKIRVEGRRAPTVQLACVLQEVMASVDLASILTSSKALNSHLQTRPDLPTVNLGLDQVELQSRRLVNGQGGASRDTGKA